MLVNSTDTVTRSVCDRQRRGNTCPMCTSPQNDQFPVITAARSRQYDPPVSVAHSCCMPKTVCCDAACACAAAVRALWSTAQPARHSSACTHTQQSQHNSAAPHMHWHVPQHVQVTAAPFTSLNSQARGWHLCQVGTRLILGFVRWQHSCARPAGRAKPRSGGSCAFSLQGASATA